VHLVGYPKKWLIRDASRLSETLRSRTTESIPQKLTTTTTTTLSTADKKPVAETEDRNDNKDEPVKLRSPMDAPAAVYNKQQSIAYVAHRLPGIYACNVRVLNEVRLAMIPVAKFCFLISNEPTMSYY